MAYNEYGIWEDEGVTNNEDTYENSYDQMTPEDRDVLLGLKEGRYDVSGSQILDKAGNLIKDWYNSGALGQAVTSLLNNNQLQDLKSQNEKFRYQATDALSNIANEIAGMSQPDLEALARARPDLLPLIQQTRSQYADINVDPTAMAASKQSLGQLQDISQQGYGPIERAAAARVLQQMSNANRGQQEAIKTDLASRGQYGVGQELTARMLAGQAEANKASQEGLEIESQAAKRALDAIRDKGTLGREINEQEFNQQAQAAKAQDVINQFNSEMAQKTNTANLEQQNLQQQRQMATRQQEYENELAKQKARQTAAAAAGTNAAKMYGDNQKTIQAGIVGRNQDIGNVLGGQKANTNQAQSGNNTTNNVNNVAKAVDTGSKLYTIGKGIWDWYSSDEDVKTDKQQMSDDDIYAILDGLAPMSYKYKAKEVKKGSPKGHVVGVMAQDIEQTPAAGMVRENNGVKQVDAHKAISLALASLGSVHNRLKKLEG